MQLHSLYLLNGPASNTTHLTFGYEFSQKIGINIKKAAEYHLEGIELGNGESSHNLGDTYENNDERKQKIIEREFINKHVNKIKTNKHIDKIKINKHEQKIIRDKSKTDPMDKFRKKNSILIIKGNYELIKIILYFIYS